MPLYVQYECWHFLMELKGCVDPHRGDLVTKEKKKSVSHGKKKKLISEEVILGMAIVSQAGFVFSIHYFLNT